MIGKNIEKNATIDKEGNLWIYKEIRNGALKPFKCKCCHDKNNFCNLECVAFAWEEDKVENGDGTVDYYYMIKLCNNIIILVDDLTIEMKGEENGN